MKTSSSLAGLRIDWPLTVLAAIGAVFIFANLGSDFLWEDEGDTAALAVNILKFGVPKAWDGGAFLDSDHGARLNRDLVMVTHPWVQYYLTAASFLVFGENTFAARIPFAIAGWMSILFVFLFVWRLFRNRLTAFSAAALLVFSVQFLLYAKQCRYCALNMLLVVWLFWTFFKMNSARDCVLFILASVFLFHTHPYGIAPMVALGALALIYRPFVIQRRVILFATPEIALFLSALVRIVFYGLETASSHSSDSLWRAGMRYASAVLPLASMVSGLANAKVSRTSELFSILLLLVFGLPKLAQLTPWVAG